MQDLLSLNSLFTSQKGKKLLCVFPHADDESFVSGGLFQVAQKYGILTKVVILTKGTIDELPGKVRKEEMTMAIRILGIDECVVYDFTENTLKANTGKLKIRLEKDLSDPEVFSVLTFDPTGVTGHEDHIVTSVLVLDALKHVKRKTPLLLWRIPGRHEQKFFLKDKKLPMVAKATYVYNLSLRESIKKLRAIFSYRSQLKNVYFKLRIIEWYLFDHRELYHLVNIDKENLKLSFK